MASEGLDRRWPADILSRLKDAHYRVHLFRLSVSQVTLKRFGAPTIDDSSAAGNAIAADAG
jgi:hypothetical protein